MLFVVCCFCCLISPLPSKDIHSTQRLSQPLLLKICIRRFDVCRAVLTHNVNTIFDRGCVTPPSPNAKSGSIRKRRQHDDDDGDNDDDDDDDDDGHHDSCQDNQDFVGKLLFLATHDKSIRDLVEKILLKHEELSHHSDQSFTCCALLRKIQE